MSDRTPLDTILTYSLEKRERLILELDHEIRFPLTEISFSELVLDQPNLTPGQIDFFKQLYDGSKAIIPLVNQVIWDGPKDFADNMGELSVLVAMLSSPIPLDLVLDTKGERHLSHVTSGQRKLRSVFDIVFSLGSSETFFFKKYVELYLTLNADTLAERGIELFNQIKKFPLETDTKDYMLVLDNLFGNAIKYGFRGDKQVGEKRYIRVNTFANHDPNLVRVSNNGRRFNRECIVAKAIEQGILPVDYERMSDGEIRNILGGHDYSNLSQKYRIATDYREQLLLQFAFFPGISTSTEDQPLDLTFSGSGSSRGQGLSIAKKLVEQNGGHIWLTSNPGDTRIYFTIPEKRVISGQSH